MSDHTHLRPQDVTPDSDPYDVAESIIDDAERDDLDTAFATGDAAEEQGVPLPDDAEMERVERAVEDAEDRALDDLLGF